MFAAKRKIPAFAGLPLTFFFDKPTAAGIFGRVNKKKLLAVIVEKLQQDLALYHKAAVAARAEATHEQSKAENKYDTRGLEASYLARGQSKQAAEISQSIEILEKLSVREFGAAEAIDVGALVELQNGKERNLYFIAARAGGTEVEYEKREVLVITPESPLGSQLLGKRSGEKCVLEIGGTRAQFKVSAVW